MTSELEIGIERLVTPALEAMGFRLVRVRLIGRQERNLQIMVEPLDGTTLTVADCSKVSRAVSALLDVEDPIKGAYNLEISSPGIDRPLVRPQDYERYAGHVVKIEIRMPREGRKKFRGRLIGLADDEVRIDMDEGVVVLPLADIVAAKLVLTDELIAEALKSGRV